jgi:hypothetical protein
MGRREAGVGRPEGGVGRSEEPIGDVFKFLFVFFYADSEPGFRDVGMAWILLTDYQKSILVITKSLNPGSGM